MQAFKAWFPFAITLTLVAALVYGASQQILRQSANDPQIQMAEDWTDQISFGTDVSRLSLGAFVDPTDSLATFGIVYDQSGNIANASVTAPSTMLQPDGVLTSVENLPNNEARFTWQPSSGTRFAVVIKKATFEDKVYYVLAGRNLREVERRINQVFAITSAGWAVGLVGVLAAQHLHVAHRAYHHIAKRITKRSSGKKEK